MKIGNRTEYIELEKLEKIPGDIPCAGDINLSVSLNFQKFKGSYSGIWLEAPEIEGFIHQLEAFDNDRKGSAKITGMSPEELVLEIRPSDHPGHIEIEVQLHRYQYSENGSKYWPVYLRGGFEAASDTIKQFVSCFKTFID